MKRWLCGFMAFCILLMPVYAAAEDESLSSQGDVSLTTTPVPEATQAPENTDAPTATPENTSQVPEATPVPENTDAPTATPENTQQIPEVTPVLENTPAPIDWESAWQQEAWFYEDGYTAIFAGTLNDVIHELLARDEAAQTEDEHEVVLCNDEDVLEIRDVHRQDMPRFLFMMDDRVIEEADKKVIRIEELREDDDLEQPSEDPEDVVSFRVWIERIPELTDEPTDTPTDTPTDAPTDAPIDTPTDEPTDAPTDAPTDTPTDGPTDEPTDEPTSEPTDAPTAAPLMLGVESENYTAGQWMNTLPVFKLSGMPENADYWEYAVVEYGKRIELIEGDLYETVADGQYTLRFVMLDDLGDVAASSENYDIMVDITEPEIMVNTMTGVSYQMEIIASDEQSGVEAVSIDGGETWTLLSPEEPFLYTGSKTDNVIAAGKIQVRDLAGNVAVYPDEVLLERVSYGGGGGGGGDDKPYQPHASGSGESGPGYDQVTVEGEAQPMHVLSLDGEEMELELNLDAAQDFEFDETYLPVFSMSLAVWPTIQLDEDGNALPLEEAAADENAQPDTMILEAQIDEGIAGDYAYRWKIGGATMRQLMKSGVKYLVLKTGDHVTTLPTEGFLAGERYTELKMQGTSTRRFFYDIVMSRTQAEESDELREPICTSEVYVTVDEQTTLLNSDETQEMYMINVFEGPSELLSVPYGLWTDEMPDGGITE